MGYIAQRDGSRCGPFAAANVAEWLGVRAADARFRLANLCRLMKTDPKEGTECSDFTKVLRKLLKKYNCTVRLIKGDIDTIGMELRANKIVVVATRFVDYSDPCDHFYVIIDHSHDLFKVVNFYAKGRDRVIDFIHKQDYERLLRDKISGTYAAVVTRYAR